MFSINGYSEGVYSELTLDDDMPFGKYDGYSVNWVVENYPNYIIWLINSRLEDDYEDDLFDEDVLDKLENMRVWSRE